MPSHQGMRSLTAVKSEFMAEREQYPATNVLHHVHTAEVSVRSKSQAIDLPRESVFVVLNAAAPHRFIDFAGRGVGLRAAFAGHRVSIALVRWWLLPTTAVGLHSEGVFRTTAPPVARSFLVPLVVKSHTVEQPRRPFRGCSRNGSIGIYPASNIAHQAARSSGLTKHSLPCRASSTAPNPRASSFRRGMRRYSSVMLNADARRPRCNCPDFGSVTSMRFAT